MRKTRLRVGYLGRWALGAAVCVFTSLNGSTEGRGEVNQPIGYLAGQGQVRIDRQPAFPGAAIFAGDVVATEKDSTAVVNLQSGTAVRVAEKSEVTFLMLANHPGLNLERGAILVRSAGPETIRVNAVGTSVLVEGRSGFPAVSRIASVGGWLAVAADQGRVEVHGAGPPMMLPPGHRVTFEAGQPQAAGQKAGTVSNEIPDEVVQRQGQTTETPLRLSDLVNWEDLVRTMRTGRVRIALLDGSFLNIGARSTMRITKHDPRTQQTQIELTLGRLRGEVVKLGPGGSFEVRTQTAVIGVVGTIFIVHALPQLTRVFSVEGLVSVRNIDPAIAGTVTLHAGEYATVARALPPTGAARVTTGRMQSELNQTQAGGPTPTAPGAPPAQAVTTTTTVANIGTPAAGATSAALAGVSVSRLGAAQSSLSQATSNLRGTADASQTAASAAADAVSAANAAGNTASAVNVGLQTVIQAVSAAFPSACGCSP